jgi:Na+/proline symporter
MQSLDPLVAWDWAVIGAFFITTLAIGLYFSRRAVSSLSDYFVAGRKMTWWVAGTSMVATSFAADTPLVISGWSRTIGLQRNWFWWGGIMGFMLCTFFFARLWRRAKVLTDQEFNELRYAGKPAASLRIFQATYISLIRNTLTMSWVTLAMTKIFDVTLEIPTLVFVKSQWLPVIVAKGIAVTSVVDAGNIATWPGLDEAIIPAKATGILICFGVAAAYTTIAGLWGVMATDFFQFFFAMTATVILMAVVLRVAGGPTNMVEQANKAVQSGIVRNRAAVLRQELKEDDLTHRLLIKPAVGTAKDEQSALHAAPVVIAQLLANGLFTRSSGQSDGVLLWQADGLNRQEMVDRLNRMKIQPPQQNAILSLWQDAYTFSKSGLTHEGTRKKLLKGGIFFAAQGANAEAASANRYRLAKLNWSEDQLLEKIRLAGVVDAGEIMAVWRHDRVLSSTKITSFLPPFDLEAGFLAVWAFIVFISLQWWAGGAGDGFLAQRIFSCKDERHSVFAMLWYNFAMFVMRPWPWIVVGIASLFLVPDVTQYAAHYDQEHAYVIMLMKYLPVGLKGLMVAALMAAYMSTISTHVNFGASYVVNDLYKRFIHPTSSEKTLVRVSQIASIFLAFIAGIWAFHAQSVGDQWFIYFEMMSGAGIVIPLRWYWWRVNAWTEISAMISSLVIFSLMRMTTVFHTLFGLLGMPEFWLDEYAVRFTVNLVLTAAVWLTVTYLTGPEKTEHLVKFYLRVRPAGAWGPITGLAGNPDHLTVGWREWFAWILGVTGLFSMIFSLGHACFGNYPHAFGFATYAVVATGLLFKLISIMDWTSIETHAE